MEIGALRERIQATLDSNTDRRRQAELDLKYVSAIQHSCEKVTGLTH